MPGAPLPKILKRGPLNFGEYTTLLSWAGGPAAKTADCKSATKKQRRFESSSAHSTLFKERMIQMKGMTGIYRINPALVGGIAGGCTGILIRLLLHLIFNV